MMTQGEIATYRQRLLTLMKRLAGDRSQLKDEALRTTGGEASGGLSDVPLHLGDLGSHEFEEAVTLGLVENEEQIIAEINGALARIEDGTFGRCEECQKPIPKKRLEALPYSRSCIACAQKHPRRATP